MDLNGQKARCVPSEALGENLFPYLFQLPEVTQIPGLTFLSSILRASSVASSCFSLTLTFCLLLPPVKGLVTLLGLP